jgi:PGF-pre-PGF domain-containing protein
MMVLKRHGLALAGLLIIAIGTIVTPVMAADHTLNPGDSIQVTITNAISGDTIILNPGIYNEHDIILDKNITIRANISAGSSAADTIIDAENAGRIFSNNESHALTVENLTLMNGYVTDRGGAIASGNGSITIISTTFSNCSASGGGAIYAFNSTLTIVSSSFVDCSASSGGAIWIKGDLTTRTMTTSISSSTFSNCSATSSGGAISVYSETSFNRNVPPTIITVTITSATFSNCSAGLGGAIYGSDVTTFTITSSTFSNSSAGSGGSGGAIYTHSNIITTTTITSSTFSNCSAYDGGAILAMRMGDTVPNTLTIISSTFSNCSAIGQGGAIRAWVDTITITTSTFSSCSSSYIGGAITALGDSNLTVSTSTFSNCSAYLGNAIYADDRTVIDIHFSRISNDHGRAILNSGGTVDASNNWWGTNNDPSGFTIGGVTVSPWLVLGITATPSSITDGQTSVIRTNLTRNSAGTDTTSGGTFVPDDIKNTFTVSAGSSSVSPLTNGTAAGVAQTTFTPVGAGTNIISATVDNQTVFITLPVTPSQDQSDSSGDSSLPAIILPMMVTVNIGGNSAAGKSTVTGTKLSELIVTGTVQPGPGSNITAPPGIVYEYFSLVPARFTSITNAVINFTVSQSWLDENYIAPGRIILYHHTANGWTALPTTVLYVKDGTVYFSALSNGFSLFSIAGTPGNPATPVSTVKTQAVVSSPVQEKVPVQAAVTQSLVTTQTTAPPATTPKPSAPWTIIDIILGIAAVSVLAAGGFLARRWWVRRQNPALFREYD